MRDINTLNQMWNLSANPFCPAIDPMGHEFQDLEHAKHTLDPSREQQAQIIALYFDTYDWSGSRDIRGLGSPQGLSQFPNLKGLAATRDIMVVVVAGWDSTGVRSLVNLIRYKASSLIITPRLSTPVDPNHKRSIWATSIIKSFINQYAPQGHPEHANLQAIYSQELSSLEKSPDRYGELIASIIDYIRSSPPGPTTNLPVTMIIDDRENIHYSLWMDIYSICYDLINLLVIPSHNPIAGEVGHKTFIQNRVKSLFIKAIPLDIQKAHTYLSQRLALYRIAEAAGVNDIAPFTEAALLRLYEKTNPADQRPFDLPIGKLNLTFRHAMDKLVAQLDQFIQQNGPEALPNIDSQQKLIQPALIDQVRRDINNGIY